MLDTLLELQTRDTSIDRLRHRRDARVAADGVAYGAVRAEPADDASADVVTGA
mgnify:CR=1 FL=1